MSRVKGNTKTNAIVAGRGSARPGGAPAPLMPKKNHKKGRMKIGIVAIQGDFAAHAAMLRALGAETVEVRMVEDLKGCDGVVLPGGESTTQLQFLKEEGLFDTIREFARQG